MIKCLKYNKAKFKGYGIWKGMKQTLFFWAMEVEFLSHEAQNQPFILCTLARHAMLVCFNNYHKCKYAK